MSEIEVGFLVAVILLLVLASMSLSTYQRSCGAKGYKFNGHKLDCECHGCCDTDSMTGGKEDPTHTPTSYGSDQGFAGGMEGMVANPRQPKVVGDGGDWEQEIQNVGIDPATFNSHKEWTSELLGKTTGSSPWSVLDHDNSVNPFLGLRHNLTYKDIYAQPGARRVESSDWQDMPAASSLRWRCHDYAFTNPGGGSCPWPPSVNPEDTYAQGI